MGQALCQLLSARNRAWPQIGSINVCGSILVLSHLAGHRESRPGMEFGKGPMSYPTITNNKNTAQSLSQGGNKTQRGVVPVSGHTATTGRAGAGNTGFSV